MILVLIGVGFYLFISPILEADNAKDEIIKAESQEFVNEYDLSEPVVIENAELHEMLNLGFNDVTEENVEMLTSDELIAPIIDIVTNEIYSEISDDEGGLCYVQMHINGNEEYVTDMAEKPMAIAESNFYSTDGGCYYATLDENYNIVYYKVNREYLEAIANTTDNNSTSYEKQEAQNTMVSCLNYAWQSDNEVQMDNISAIKGQQVVFYNSLFNGDYSNYFIEHKLDLAGDATAITSTIFFDENIFYKSNGNKYETKLTGDTIITFDACLSVQNYEGTEEEKVDILTSSKGTQNQIYLYIVNNKFLGLIE